DAVAGACHERQPNQRRKDRKRGIGGRGFPVHVEPVCCNGLDTLNVVGRLRLPLPNDGTSRKQNADDANRSRSMIWRQARATRDMLRKGDPIALQRAFDGFDWWSMTDNFLLAGITQRTE